jgi:hypothetical protein
MFVTANAPRTRIMRASTTTAYGLLNAALTIHMPGHLEGTKLGKAP